MTTPDYVRAYRHSSRHRQELMTSETCGRFYCRAVFRPSEVEDWVDEWEGIEQIALCPRCGIDSVIGSESGYPITKEFLTQMRAHWFD
jgi:hypothetical protein